MDFVRDYLNQPDQPVDGISLERQLAQQFQTTTLLTDPFRQAHIDSAISNSIIQLFAHWRREANIPTLTISDWAHNTDRFIWYIRGRKGRKAKPWIANHAVQEAIATYIALVTFKEAVLHHGLHTSEGWLLGMRLVLAEYVGSIAGRATKQPELVRHIVAETLDSAFAHHHLETCPSRGALIASTPSPFATDDLDLPPALRRSPKTG
ncbi:hypothetical protein Sulac_1206 [Sulfobacillus acidophilus DSM 10332]|uniref:Uncharacterized protein n=1 Tax=Sulfobacillus acidophilus (strain ATCC 700253 / DSM 10332 / NAL) TaxID=679936 RepID=G8TV66_SULAD|nr:hypothetical protein Sulac_1206 [Sulfobacillus acidophilus DSM 10332]